ncbi:hypothetical protein CASFOL_007488 [Castilleja foliolosa]|uniref:Uncharacterized protein n=1 Tax=Castilleja foliolosa TaxID=1961234 RepID=A0ABD3ED73_9LAMI
MDIIPTENYFFDCDDLNAVEFPIIDKSLVMSLLDFEDSSFAQMEDGDDETLRAVIQSLEREIDSTDEYSENYRLSDDEQPESCSTSSVNYGVDFDWVDAEMDYSCPDNEITSYFIGNYIDHELGILGDYSEFCYEMPMEEDEYFSLWQ